jgi:ABC-2 type transport system ATP-binding protein
MDIKVKNLSKKFNNFLAVNNISFTLEKNKTLGLLGSNGCGKTTSIGMMLGLINPTSGEVLIDNKNVSSNSHNDLLSRMNFASLSYQKN